MLTSQQSSKLKSLPLCLPGEYFLNIYLSELIRSQHWAWMFFSVWDFKNFVVGIPFMIVHTETLWLAQLISSWSKLWSVYSNFKVVVQRGKVRCFVNPELWWYKIIFLITFVSLFLPPCCRISKEYLDSRIREFFIILSPWRGLTTQNCVNSRKKVPSGQYLVKHIIF